MIGRAGDVCFVAFLLRREVPSVYQKKRLWDMSNASKGKENLKNGENGKQSQTVM